MLVCSLPRCGATGFCLDLEAAIRLPFAGELHPIHIGSDRKSIVHETKYQPNFKEEQFADLLHDNSNHIVLVNQHPYLVINRADVVVLRRNMKDASYSLVKFLIAMYPSIKPGVIVHQLKLMHYDHIALMSYLNKYPKDIVWYEDYYNRTGTDMSAIEAYRGKENIIKEIETYYGSSN